MSGAHEGCSQGKSVRDREGSKHSTAATPERVDSEAAVLPQDFEDTVHARQLKALCRRVGRRMSRQGPGRSPSMGLTHLNAARPREKSSGVPHCGSSKILSYLVSHRRATRQGKHTVTRRTDSRAHRSRLRPGHRRARSPAVAMGSRSTTSVPAAVRAPLHPGPPGARGRRPTDSIQQSITHATLHLTLTDIVYYSAAVHLLFFCHAGTHVRCGTTPLVDQVRYQILGRFDLAMRL